MISCGTDSILRKIGPAALKEFIELWSTVETLDKAEALRLASNAMKYYRNTKMNRIELRRFQQLEAAWYRSLEAGCPDYSVYSDPYILADLWPCWCIYSRKYLLSVQKYIPRSITSIVDLGCGFAYTTAALREIFPRANVFGTNLEGGVQWKFAEMICKRHGCFLVPSIQHLNQKIDLVFASEYFEHIEHPVEHLESILMICAPEYLVIANTFNAMAIGHFKVYKHRDGWFDQDFNGRQISKMFNAELRKAGYVNMETKCWNNRPMFWRKA